MESAPETSTVRTLLLPADPGRACQLRFVGVSSAELSDAIGGGLLEDVSCAGPGQRCYLYLDEERDTKRLPDNARAARLAAALDWTTAPAVPLDRSVRLRGDVLVTGIGALGEDADVPDGVVAAAVRLGLLAG